MATATRRSALIVAIGLVLGFAAPSRAEWYTDAAPSIEPSPSKTAASSTDAAPSADAASGTDAAASTNDAVSPAARPIRQTHPVAPHRPIIVKSAHVRQDANTARNASTKPSGIPPSVANANAQLRSSDIPAADAPPAAAAETPPASPAVAASQLNDADRAVRGGAPPVPAAAVASAGAEPPPARTATASTNEHSVWDETSLAGKIFVGFGALLTVASAARMFMA